MDKVIQSIIENYGIFGLLVIMVGTLCYLIYNDRKNNWGSKIDKLGDKMDIMHDKIEFVETKLSNRIDNIEHDIERVGEKTKAMDKKLAKEQTQNIMVKGLSSKISKTLKNSCKTINCDHIFLGTFHNGTTDLRGMHYCKFDIIADEFLNPLELRDKDTEFCTLYKDENIIAYGDLPYTAIKAELLSLTQDQLLEYSDTLYRRCVGRDIKRIALSIIHDQDGDSMGFIGCIKFDDEDINISELKATTLELEKIYENI